MEAIEKLQKWLISHCYLNCCSRSIHTTKLQKFLFTKLPNVVLENLDLPHPMVISGPEEWQGLNANIGGFYCALSEECHLSGRNGSKTHV